jgi:replicative DNA helicase
MNAFAASPPPAVAEIEQSLLGSMLANNKAYEPVGGFLQPEHFLYPIHAHLYRTMAERIQQGRLVDALILKAELETDGMLDEVGGTPYLAQLLGSMVAISTAAEYGTAIKDAWAKREMANILDAHNRKPDNRTAQQVAADIISRLSELAEPTGARPSLSQAADTLLAEAEAAHQGHAGFERLEVGLPSVDRLLGGLWPGNLYYLMARSGAGKTSALLQFCRHIARNLTEGCVHVFSLEMPVTDLLRVSVASESRWSARQIRSGDIGSAEDWLEFKAISAAIGSLPIVVDDEPIDITALRLRARQIQRTRKSRLIVVDHLDLIRHDPRRRGMPKSEWIPQVGQDLKDLSKELGVPVLALCQVNKPRDDRAPVRPTKDSLPYDGGQAADEIHALYRRELDMPEEPPGLAILHSAEKRAAAKFEWDEQKRAARGAAEWLVLKSRFGALGTAHLKFDGPKQLFREALPTDNGLTQEEIDMFTRGETG